VSTKSSVGKKNYQQGYRQRVDAKKEALLTTALHDIETSKERSIRAAADRYGLKYETLWYRKRGAQNQWDSHEDQQHLTIDEEKVIEDWITKVDNFGWRPRVDDVHQMSLGFLQSREIRNPTIGKN
jgi:hypothetical protein